MDRNFDIEEKVNDFFNLHKEKEELEGRLSEIDAELSKCLGRLVENQPNDFVAELSSYLKGKRHVIGGCRGYSELLLLAEKKVSQ